MYLQHGFGENETSWVWQGRIANLMDNLLATKKAERMLVVMADGMLRSPENEEELAHGLFPDFFKKDLMPFIESKYAVRTDREGRAIAGLSMGSMQAAMTAFPNPCLLYTSRRQFYGKADCRDGIICKGTETTGI